MKKSLFVSILLSAILLMCASCATRPADGEPVPSTTVETELPVSDIVFPVAIARCGAYETLPAYVSGTLTSTYDPLPATDLFASAIVTQCSQPYVYKGEDRVCTYEFVYTGVAAVVDDGPVERGDIIGMSVQDEVGFIVRSKDLDPWLVTSTQNIKPVQYGGYWYFYPGVVDGRVMKWMNYYPADPEGFRWMFNHTCVPDSEEADEDWTPGASYFNWSVYLETALDSYPSLLPADQRGGSIESEQVIMWNGMPLHLNYQTGFLQYLRDEYTLGDTIYLYLNIDTISFFTQEFNCHVRDYAFESPDQMADRNIRELLGR